MAANELQGSTKKAKEKRCSRVKRAIVRLKFFEILAVILKMGGVQGRSPAVKSKKRRISFWVQRLLLGRVVSLSEGLFLHQIMHQICDRQQAWSTVLHLATLNLRH
jgi:hypothetical protein